MIIIDLSITRLLCLKFRDSTFSGDIIGNFAIQCGTTIVPYIQALQYMDMHDQSFNHIF